ARRYFEQMGRQAEIIELHGSIELAPLVGLAECIVDLTATGTTLRENHLVVLDEIASSTARLISNRGAYRLRHQEISALADAIEGG
ncbi:MAG TPA: ATP phosphoribosyltransferase, partial [Rubrobacter sp.]